MNDTAAPLPPLPPLIALDGALAPLREVGGNAGPLPLFATDSHAMDLAPGVRLLADPASAITGHWSRPDGRLAEIAAHVVRPGAWFGLHVTIPLPDLTGLTWIGLILRSSATPAAAIWPCLRSGLADGGFHDQFFPRHVLAQSRDSDHHDIIPLSWHPDLPLQAPWREIVLFLPPAEDMHLMLHDLRIIAL